MRLKTRVKEGRERLIMLPSSPSFGATGHGRRDEKIDRLEHLGDLGDERPALAQGIHVIRAAHERAHHDALAREFAVEFRCLAQVSSWIEKASVREINAAQSA